MRSLFVVFVSMFSLPLSSYSQAGNDPEQVIRRMIETEALDGHDSKVVGPMGDAAAVVITKVLADKKLGAGDIDSVLWILGQAFADPSMVHNVSDREPRTALLLLRYFDFSTGDPELKGRIAATRKYIEDHYANAMRKAAPAQ
jgi:hypothetical protein